MKLLEHWEAMQFPKRWRIRSDWAFGLLVRLARASAVSVEGVQVWGAPEEVDEIRRAFELLRTHAPRTWRRLRAHVTLVMVSSTDNRFIDKWSVCQVVVKRGQDTDYLASKLVHEATHAYLFGRRWSLERICEHELVCYRQQYLFQRAYCHASQPEPLQRADYLKRLRAAVRRDLERHFKDLGLGPEAHDRARNLRLPA